METASHNTLAYYLCSKSDAVMPTFFPPAFSKLVERVLTLTHSCAEPLIPGEQIFHYDIIGYLKKFKETALYYLDHIVI